MNFISWINVTEAKVIVIKKGEWVDILASIDHLQQGFDNLKSRLDVCDRLIQEQNTLQAKLETKIAKQDEIIKEHEKIKEIHTEMIERQESKIKAMEFWDKFKNVGLIVLVGVAAAGFLTLN